MKTTIKNFGLTLLLTFVLASCSKPEPVPLGQVIQRGDSIAATQNVLPCETIKYIDFDTATNWFGLLSWATPVAVNTYTYKLKVWQLKTGQDNLAAINNNTPLLIKNLNSTNLYINAIGQLEAQIEPINTHVVNAIYTATIIYLVETYDNTNTKVCNANSYRYSRSNKQKG